MALSINQARVGKNTTIGQQIGEAVEIHNTGCRIDTDSQVTLQSHRDVFLQMKAKQRQCRSRERVGMQQRVGSVRVAGETAHSSPA